MKHIARILVLALMISMLCIGGASASYSCVGEWRYDDYTIWYQFTSNGLWSEYLPDGEYLDGYYDVSGDTVRTYFWDGSELTTFEIDGEVLIDDEGDTLFRRDLPDFDDNELIDNGFTGVWEVKDDAGAELTGYNVYYKIYAAGNFVAFTPKNGPVQAGTVRLLDDDTIAFYDSSDDTEIIQEWRISGKKLINVDDPDETCERSEIPYETPTFNGRLDDTIVDQMDSYFRDTLHDTFNGSDWSHDYLDDMELLGYYKIINKTNDSTDVYLLYRVTAHNSAVGTSMTYYWFGCYEDISITSYGSVSADRRVCFTNNAGSAYKLYLGSSSYYYYGYSTRDDFTVDQIEPLFNSNYNCAWFEAD